MPDIYDTQPATTTRNTTDFDRVSDCDILLGDKASH